MIIVIGGPTGVGKTELSLALAKKYDCEIISADSMQVYKGMDIGTAKATKDERGVVVHHLLDIVRVEEEFSVAEYQESARAAIDDIISRGKTPMFVGGSGFYIKAALHDFTFENTRRDEAFEAAHAHYDNQTLHRMLEGTDPRSASTIHPNNRVRVLQALRRAREGNPKSAHTSGDKPLYDYSLIVLEMPRQALYRRIEQRVDAMIERGLIEEAKALHSKPLSKTAYRAIGYKELYRYFEGVDRYAEAIDNIKTNTRRLAKRQYTYFYNQFNYRALSVHQNALITILDKASRIVDASPQTKKDHS